MNSNNKCSFYTYIYYILFHFFIQQNRLMLFILIKKSSYRRNSVIEDNCYKYYITSYNYSQIINKKIFINIKTYFINKIILGNKLYPLLLSYFLPTFFNYFFKCSRYLLISNFFDISEIFIGLSFSTKTIFSSKDDCFLPHWI